MIFWISMPVGIKLLDWHGFVSFIFFSMYLKIFYFTRWKNFARSLCSMIFEIGLPWGHVKGFSQLRQFFIISCIWNMFRYVFAFTAALHDVVIKICSSILSIFPDIFSNISCRISAGGIFERICGIFLKITSLSLTN